LHQYGGEVGTPFSVRVVTTEKNGCRIPTVQCGMTSIPKPYCRTTVLRPCVLDKNTVNSTYQAHFLWPGVGDNGGPARGSS
ncbi:hypothetical protein XENORESO_021845, partial [Xenotaenia resolanae]